jgi:preprotein translocase subunit SecF
MLDIVGKRYLYFAVSLLIIIPGLISLLIPPHLRVGNDFTGGTLWIVVPKDLKPANGNQIAALLAQAGHSGAQVQNATIIANGTTTNTVQMRLDNLTPEEKEKLVKVLIDNNIVNGTTETTTVNTGASATGTVTTTATLTTTGTVTATTATGTTTVQTSKLADGVEIAYTTVGATIGSEVAGRAVFAVLLASLGILAYLWYAFRRVPNAGRYGVCAVIALLHDVLVVLGVFSILGRFFDIEVDALFITAMLTVIGFSVHDTIVVFDRIRENMLKRRFDTFEKVVNYSLVQTLTRSINTSLTVIFTLFALYLFGGVSIRNFILALLVGIISGTFSSIINASLLLVAWENRDWRHGWWRAARSAENEPAA